MDQFVLDLPRTQIIYTILFSNPEHALFMKQERQMIYLWLKEQQFVLYILSMLSQEYNSLANPADTSNLSSLNPLLCLCSTDM